jgi:hypothetical protein
LLLVVLLPLLPPAPPLFAFGATVHEAQEGSEDRTGRQAGEGAGDGATGCGGEQRAHEAVKAAGIHDMTLQTRLSTAVEAKRQVGAESPTSVVVLLWLSLQPFVFGHAQRVMPPWCGACPAQPQLSGMITTGSPTATAPQRLRCRLPSTGLISRERGIEQRRIERTIVSVGMQSQWQRGQKEFSLPSDQVNSRLQVRVSAAISARIIEK